MSCEMTLGPGAPVGAPDIARLIAELEESAVATNEAAARERWSMQYQEGWQWIERFIMQAHPDLGRKGAVCPFARPSHNVGGMYFSSLDATGLSFESFIQVLLQLPDAFKRLSAQSGASPDLFSLTIFIEGLDSEQHYQFIDLAHAVTKPLFMNAGLMLGEFRPHSPVPGVHSDRFRPMQAPLPCFVIRAIAVHDKLFFSQEGSVTRAHEIACYLNWVGHKLPEAEYQRFYELLGTARSRRGDAVLEMQEG
ncbi:DUF6875 domain-containing protein [Chitinimonas lacunae]|uniref:DUF6875 domain-containing protein n=1 Tax=Chitinimonas lacunae TaxID=1963018 RepID=A0ABV8MQM5_9NEIS